MDDPGLVISTGSPNLDSLLRGGIRMGRITEVFGPPGCGKTQLGMHLSANAVVSTSVKQDGLSVIYVDTEWNFRRGRFDQILQKTAERKGCASRNLSNVSRRVRVLRPEDLDEFLSTVALLPETFRDLPDVGLVVIDSIAHPFRCVPTDLDFVERAKLLSNMHEDCLRLCRSHGVAVLMTNQLTVDVGSVSSSSSSSSESTAAAVPSLGDAWANYPAFRLGLDFHGGPTEPSRRRAYLYKASFVSEASNSVVFSIADPWG